MPSADAPLRNSIQVGNTPPTGPQTLLNLLNLYESDNTDYPTWVETLESHAVTLLPLLAARPPKQLIKWHDTFTLEDLRRGALTIANQVNLKGISSLNGQNQRTSQIGLALGHLVDPELAQQPALTCRLIGQNISIPDPEVTDALTYFDRPLSTLHGSPLLTRLVAVASHCSTESEANIDECASLLFLSAAQIDSALSELPHPESSIPITDVSSRFELALNVTNLIDSSVALARQTSRDSAIQTLASGLFGSRAVATFTENSTGWFNQLHQLGSPQSMVNQAATSAEAVSTDEIVTVADEKVLGSMGSKNGLAIPIFISENDAPICVAVTLLALNPATLATALSSPNLIEQFARVCRHLFTAQLDKGIDAESIDNRAREIIHEANNPISTVQNYLKVLSLKLGPEHDAQETLESISSELSRAAEIVRSFNDLKLGPVNQSGVCEVNKVTRQIGALFDQGHDIEFEYQLDESNPNMQIHSNDLKQILTNLIKNATESTSRGDTISLSTAGNLMQGNNTFVELAVRDTGPGITGDIGNVFDKGVTTKSGEHIGEGLAVVRQLTEATNGFVSYRSDQHGTEFRITIPQFQHR
jgi:signal transduction histidine kinase